jgi:hypothetical protein
MKKFAIWAVLSAVMFGTLSTVASADRGRRRNDGRIVVKFYDQQYRGSSTLYLKRAAKNQYPRLNLRNFKLNSIKLVAKSRQGRGQAKLFVGRNVSYAKTVYGNPGEFNDSSPYTFDRVQFQSPSRSGRGAWQIDLRGNFIVRKVVLFVTRLGQGPGQGGRVRAYNINAVSNGEYRSMRFNGRITRVTLLRQRGRRRCVLNRSYGVDRNVFWVSRGCSGSFKILVRLQGGGGRRRSFDSFAQDKMGIESMDKMFKVMPTEPAKK